MIKNRLMIIQLIVVLAVCSPFAVAVRAEDTVKVAVNVAKTGIKVESDVGMFIGAEFAAEKINSEGGLLGRRLELIYLDNRSTGLGAKQAAELAVEMNVIAVVGAGAAKSQSSHDHSFFNSSGDHIHRRLHFSSVLHGFIAGRYPWSLRL